MLIKVHGDQSNEMNVEISSPLNRSCLTPLITFTCRLNQQLY